MRPPAPMMATGAGERCLPIVSIDEFQASLDAHGPDLASWPDAERESGQGLLATSEYARQLHEVAVLLNKELGGRTVRAPRDLVDRIMAKALGARGRDPNS